MGAAVPSRVNRLWAFVRREWPLCVFAALSFFVVFWYDDAPRRLACLLGLAGGLVCLKRFGLDHCPWIYLLAGVLACLAQISLDDAKELRASYNLLRFWKPLFICLMFASCRGMLASIPFSLLFLRKLPGFSALWKIPLCVFFIILALEPFFLSLAFTVMVSFTSCP